LPCWATSNFSEIRLLHRDEELDTALVVPERSLRPDLSDARADQMIAEQNMAPLLHLVEQLARAPGRSRTRGMPSILQQ
jgi:hypothetical protein